MKYKPCCSSRCLLGTCETRDNGGCYCVCRWKDAESTCISLLEGRSFRHGGGIIYEPNRIPVPLKGDEKDQISQQLEAIRERLKKYETPNDEEEGCEDVKA